MTRKAKKGQAYRETPEKTAEMKAKFAHVKKMFAEPVDVDGLLDRIEQETQRLIEAKPPEAMATDAHSALGLLTVLRQYVERGDARNIALTALQLGVTCERLKLRPVERLIEQGRRSFAAKARSRQPRTDNAKEDHERYKQRVDEIQRTSRMNLTGARRRASIEMQISMSTVYRRIRAYDQ